MNIINITSATDIKFLYTPTVLDIDHDHEGLCSVTCEAEITTNNVTFRVHAVASCESVGDGFGEVKRVDGWLDMRAKEADSTSIALNTGALVDLKVHSSAKLEIVKAILTPFMHHLRVSDEVHHLPIRPSDYVHEYKTWAENTPMFVICKQGTLFGVYNQKKQMVEVGGCATKQDAHKALLTIIANEKTAAENA